MAHNIIPRKAVGSGSQSPEPPPGAAAAAAPPSLGAAPTSTSDTSTSTSPPSHPPPPYSAQPADGSAIKRKPVDSALANKRASAHDFIHGAAAASTPQSAGFTVRTDEPLDLRFALGPGGLHAWYDPMCKAKPEGLAPSWSAHGLMKKMQLKHDDFKEIIDEKVLDVQLLQASTGGLTCLVYTDQEGNQQQHCEMPLKTPLSLVGPGKHSYQKCEEAHGNLIPWITTCMVNGVPLEDIQIAFGPDDAYYAYETVKRKVQNRLLIDLQDCLDSCPNELPAHLSMGTEGAWSVLWADGTHQHHIMPNSFATLCALMERPDLPRLKRVMLSPTRQDEFIIEYENGHYFVRARMQRDDVAKLDAYLKRKNGSTKVVIIGVDSKPLKGDFICRPFVLPVSDFASTPYGELSREGSLAEWRDHYNIHDLMLALTEISKEAGACPVM